VLEVSGLSSGYASSQVVNGVDLRVGDGEIVAVIGRNGMGKTTLLKAVLGLLPRWSGSVTWAGTDVTRKTTHRLIRAGIAYAPQEEAIFGGFTVEENLRAGSLTGAAPREAWDEVLEHFPLLGQRLKQRAGTLSGGEQRMLLMARALLARPRLLLIDEICDGLHPPVVARVVEILRDYRERHGMAVLIVEPNLLAVLDVADRVLVMKAGAFVLERSPSAKGARADLERELVFA
jgi:ABC-type branched-subunit amino acid transport system ATPase component